MGRRSSYLIYSSGNIFLHDKSFASVLLSVHSGITSSMIPSWARWNFQRGLMSCNTYIVCEAQNALNGKPITVGDPSRWTWAPFQDWDWFIVVSKVHKKLSGFLWLWCSSRLSSRELTLALDAALVQIWATCESPQCPEKYQSGDLAVQEQHRNPKTGPVHALLSKTIQGLTKPREFFPKLTQPQI